MASRMLNSKDQRLYVVSTFVSIFLKILLFKNSVTDTHHRLQPDVRGHRPLSQARQPPAPTPPHPTSAGTGGSDGLAFSSFCERSWESGGFVLIASGWSRDGAREIKNSTEPPAVLTGLLRGEGGFRLAKAGPCWSPKFSQRDPWLHDGSPGELEKNLGVQTTPQASQPTPAEAGAVHQDFLLRLFSWR